MIGLTLTACYVAIHCNQLGEFSSVTKSIIAALLLASLSGSLLAEDIPGGNLTDVQPDFSWNSNLRWSVDLSNRYIHNENDSYFQNVMGFDLHKVFSSDSGDIGTLVFQPYVVNLDNKNGTPHFFDGKDTELTWRIANFNFTGLSKGGMNFRVGHFEIPFGLEQNIDTNGTLRQYTFADRGIKADWGVSVNGVLPSWDYEIALTRGSGNDITDRHEPYVFSGRIGSPSQKNLVAGFSWFDGEVLTAHGKNKRQRLGLDLAWYRYNWESLVEISAGEDEGSDVTNALAEVSWRNRTETFHGYVQINHRQQKQAGSWETGSTATIGINSYLANNFFISGEWANPIDTTPGTPDSSTLSLQLRYRL